MVEKYRGRLNLVYRALFDPSGLEAEMLERAKQVIKEKAEIPYVILPPGTYYASSIVTAYSPQGRDSNLVRSGYRITASGTAADGNFYYGKQEFGRFRVIANHQGDVAENPKIVIPEDKLGMPVIIAPQGIIRLGNVPYKLISGVAEVSKYASAGIEDGHFFVPGRITVQF